MRQLAYLGVAALTAVALLGTSCSSDENGGGGGETGGAVGIGGQTGNTGGATSASTTSTKATGGSTSASTTAKTGVGGASVGGVTGAGGANIGGVTGVGGNTGAGGSATGGGSSVPVTGGLDITDGFYDDGNFSGAVWVTSDEGNAKRTDVPHTTIALPASGDEMCVTGFAPKIPLKVNPTSTSDYDYSEVWGADLGWNLNQAAAVDGGEAGAQEPADFSDVTSVTVNVIGATGLNMRVQLEAKDSSGASVYYCATLPLTNLPATIDIKTLKVNCWQTGGAAFDPATMMPVSFALAVVTSATKEYPINFCVTELKFNTGADGG